MGAMFSKPLSNLMCFQLKVSNWVPASSSVCQFKVYLSGPSRLQLTLMISILGLDEIKLK